MKTGAISQSCLTTVIQTLTLTPPCPSCAGVTSQHGLAGLLRMGSRYLGIPTAQLGAGHRLETNIHGGYLALIS